MPDEMKLAREHVDKSPAAEVTGASVTPGNTADGNVSASVRPAAASPKPVGIHTSLESVTFESCGSERKQAFNEYLAQRKKLESEEKRLKQKKAREDFLSMLEESKDLTSSMRSSKALTLFENDPRFQAVDKDGEREELYEDYLVDLERKEREKAREERKKNLAEYRAFLESCDFIKANTQWRKGCIDKFYRIHPRPGRRGEETSEAFFKVHDFFCGDTNIGNRSKKGFKGDMLRTDGARWHHSGELSSWQLCVKSHFRREEKPSPMAEEPLTYANKAEAKNAFKELLESVHVESDWTWDQTMRVIINDMRYGALKTLGERKQAFNEYLAQRKKMESEEKRLKQKKANEDFSCYRWVLEWMEK
ncbi:hypothetical protein R1flu_023925 [Riccia fluitans]|uniref:FF domain-containing protein n=1 Tax=Riccia fluitans TaxID=41844 RepID=A0ABD1XTE4_9MARC